MDPFCEMGGEDVIRGGSGIGISLKKCFVQEGYGEYFNLLELCAVSTRLEGQGCITIINLLDILKIFCRFIECA